MLEDPFELLGVDRRFELDQEALRRRFLDASARMHPDRFPDPFEQAEAVEQMSRLTDAYRVLCDPESRARALLRLSGLEAEGDRDKLPPDLLMEVMEVREALESAVESGDREELDRLRAWASAQRQIYLARLGELLEGDLDADKAAQARLQLNALRYMERMLEQMPA